MGSRKQSDWPEQLFDAFKRAKRPAICCSDIAELVRVGGTDFLLSLLYPGFEISRRP
jgi:hypothetical protein